MSEQLPQPGWYHNSQGRTQWWDGGAWGPLAEEYVADPAPAEPAGAAPAVAEAPAVPGAPEAAQPEVAQPGAAQPEVAQPVAEPVQQVAETVQPVAQDFSREFLEQQYATRPPEAPGQQGVAGPGVAGPGAAGPYAQPATPAASYPGHTGYAGAPAQTQYHYPQAPSAPKPDTHLFTWISFGAAAVALISAIAAGYTFIGVLFGLAWIAILAATVFGIIAIVQSEKKVLPVVATAVAATGFIWVPIIQVVAAFSSYNSNFYSM